ncbi:type I restriction-modification system subunit M [Simonsiella muelleri]|uniref:type I restriction-modification system subunit M n=1 Tax=Simonsiella muelleri TaxID=72 RepID=UPI0023F28D76|nr:type I restriction-modification system subunit M [Simonsiella muelleri]
MAIKKTELYSSLWASCDELRGGMDASLYKDYVLTLLFLKYVSDKFKAKTGMIDLPNGTTFDNIVALKNTANIGDKLNIILKQIAEANDLQGVIDVADFNDEEKLGKGKEQVERLSNLVSIFQKLDLSANQADGDDLLGDAYEYLMRHFATESGKSKGQFYTPAEVSRIMAKIIGIAPDSPASTTVYDPTCGSGSLLLKVATQANNTISLYGQEKDVSTASLARMNMILHNNETAEISTGNTIAAPAFLKDGQLRTFDFAVANPPFSSKNWTNGIKPENDERFAYGIPPEKNGDYAFLLHLIKSLKPTGKGAIILPHGVLFRGNAEAKIRAELLKQGLIKGIIGLPANLFYGTGIPACIIVIDKEHAQTAQFANDEKTEVVSGGNVFMIDASKYFIKDGNKNRLREQDIHKIIDTFTKRLEIAHYSRQVSLQEIVAQDYNLNLPRYIDNGEREDIQDLNAHLYGDIPVADIDDLADFWQVFPQLKNELFEAKGERYHAKLPAEQIKSHILAHTEYAQFKQRTLQPFTQWQHANNLRQMAQGNRPKELIHQWSESLLDCYKNSQLIANYDIYQILMNYWQDVMQDDVYMICQDGWDLGKQLLREIKKPEKDEKGKTPKAEPHDFVINKAKYKAELIPPTLIAKRYFGEQLAQIQTFQAAFDTASQELESYLEEHANGLLENTADDKDKITAKSLKTALKTSTDSEETTAIKHAIKLFDAEKHAKDALKTATEALDLAVFTQYGKLSASDIQTLVIDDKWLADLGGYIHSEMERVVQTLASRVQTLETRYHEPLSQIEMQVAELTAKVNAHLKAMGL